MIRDILNGLFMIGMVSASCFVCSSPNIENHYGSFFDNPREIQPAYVGRIIDCEKNEFKTQDCSRPCFSLNVSSSVIDSDFGTSYGCSTGIIPDDVDTDENCFTKTISIRTSPVYTVTATYCLCTENNCNPPIHPVIRKRSKPLKSTGKTVRKRRKIICSGKYATVIWEEPLSDMFASEFRCLTERKGEFSMEYSRYAPTTLEAQERVQAEWRQLHGIADPNEKGKKKKK